MPTVPRNKPASTRNTPSRPASSFLSTTRNAQADTSPAARRQPVIDFVSLPLNFFARPAQIVGPDLVGCRLVKRHDDGSLLWGVVVETEAYSRDYTLVTVTAAVHRKTKPCLVRQGVSMSMSATASTTA